MSARRYVDAVSLVARATSNSVRASVTIAPDCDRHPWIRDDSDSSVVVVVIRWFGGIQLGTGGLARAYGVYALTDETYAMTAVRRLASNFPEARMGADIAFIGDIPIAAGMTFLSNPATTPLILAALPHLRAGRGSV